MDRMTFYDNMEKCWRVVDDAEVRDGLPTKGEYVEQSVIDRLAAYEDTRLEPEEVREVINSLKIQILDLTQNLRNYRIAESEGRLIVLPCKVGDTVYKPYLRPLSVVPMVVLRIVQDGIDNQIIVDGGRSFCFSDIGKTVFLTSEEAELELERSKPHGD